MSRQLHPGIFDENYLPATNSASLEPLPLFEQTQILSISNEELVEQIQKTKYEIENWVKSLSLRVEKAIQKMTTFEERLNSAVKDSSEKVSFVASRIKERQLTDTKVEALIEKHNQIVQTFDLRISQAQRVIDNQSLQLAKQQQLIDEARRQIEKLKRL